MFSSGGGCDSSTSAKIGCSEAGGAGLMWRQTWHSSAGDEVSCECAGLRKALHDRTTSTPRASAMRSAGTVLLVRITQQVSHILERKDSGLPGRGSIRSKLRCIGRKYERGRTVSALDTATSLTDSERSPGDSCLGGASAPPMVSRSRSAKRHRFFENNSPLLVVDAHQKLLRGPIDDDRTEVGFAVARPKPVRTWLLFAAVDG